MRLARFALFTLLCLFWISPFRANSPSDYKTGKLLEIVPYDWCHYDCGPFTTESALVCVVVDGKTMVGEKKFGHDWQEGHHQLIAAQGMPISVRYDDAAIWLMTANSKQLRFRQTYDLDQFRIPACTAEIHRHMLNSLGEVRRPASVPAEAVLIPEGGRFFWHFYSWVHCSFDPAESDNVCTYWDKTGRMEYESHVVSAKDHHAVPQVDLQIDKYTTRRNEIYLNNGVALVSDGRARIDGKIVTGPANQ